MTPSTTVVPSSRNARTRTSTSEALEDSESSVSPLLHCCGSVSAMHRMSDVALAVYSTLMPLGIQRRPRGTVASASAPIAASRPLQMAMTWTVPKWFCTRRRLASRSSA